MHSDTLKTCLIHIGISRCGFNSYGTSQESGYISHGLGVLSAVAKAAGFDISLIDLRRLKDWGALRKELKRLNPDVVGISSMTVDMDYVKRCVKECNRILPAARIIVGGAHPSIAPEEFEQMSGVDCVVIGEGEVVFPQLLEAVKTCNPLPDRVNGVGTVTDLDTVPFVDRSIYPASEVPFHPSFPAPMVTIVAGRGCIYNCSFCQPAERLMFGSRVRRRSVENVIAELKTLRFNSLMIHDDCLTEDADWINQFCEAYPAAGFTQPFICQSRADIIVKNPEMIRRLKDAGLKMLSIGFECGNDRVLKLLRKGVKVWQNYKAAQICHELGIMIDANYMFGLPSETVAEMEETVRMIHQIKADINSIAWFTPHRGSDLYDYCVKNDLLLESGKKYGNARRNAFVPKIKGIDYRAVRSATWRARGGWTLRQWASDTPWVYKSYKWLIGVANI